MKNENKKLNKTNILVGLLIGLAVLVFGGKILLNQNPLPEAKPLDQTKVDKMIDEVKEKLAEPAEEILEEGSEEIAAETEETVTE
jgi:hypothetical protein